MRKLVLTVAGVARGESSQAAIGVILSDTQGRILERWGSPIGRATEEVAEYKALLEGLRRALPHQPGEIVVFLESRTVTNQILGHVSPREPSIQNLNRQGSGNPPEVSPLARELCGSGGVPAGPAPGRTGPL
jgi:ribonuclease HI